MGECSAHLAHYPVWSWCAFAPVALTSLTLETLAFRWVVVPKLQVVGHFKVFFGLCDSPPFWVWWLYCMSISFIHKLTFATNSLFLGVVLKADTCSGRKRLAGAWHEVLYQSSLQLL